MIIQTKNRKSYFHVKLIIAFLVVAVLSYGLGVAYGYAKGWEKCVDFGINFIKFDNIVDKDLIRSAILHYKESLGGWAFDPKSPFYIK